MGLAAETPGLDLQRACGTSLEAAILVGNKIALGQIDSAIAGGVDTVSDPPVVYPKAFQQLLLKSYRGKTAGERIGPWLGLRWKHIEPVLPGTAEPRTGLSMGESTELMVKTWGIGRTEQDQFALESHQKAAAALRGRLLPGFGARLSRTFPGQQHPRRYQPREASEAAAGIRYLGAGTLTAGNSTPMTDGASAVLLASEDWARERNLPVLAYLTYAKVAAVDYVEKKGGPVDGSGLRGAAHAQGCRTDLAGF